MSTKCWRCGLLLSSEQALQYHLGKKKKCISIICEICNGIFPSNASLCIHKSKCKENNYNIDRHKSFDMINLLDCVLVEYNSNGFVTYISSSCREVYGYKEEELIGTHYNHLIYDNDLAYIKEKQKQNIDTNKLQFRKINNEGSQVWIETQIPKFTSTRNIAVCFEKNITKEKLLEETSIRGSFAENSYDYFCECRLDGTFIYINPALESIAGYSSSNIVGLKKIDILFDNLSLSRTIDHEHYLLKKADGKCIEVEICTKIINNKFTAIFKNYQANRDDLFRSFVHEMRNPINCLCQGTEYFETLDNWERPIDKEFVELFKTQKACISLLKKLLNDFLDFETMNNKTFEISAKDITHVENIYGDIKPLIESLTYLYEKQIVYNKNDTILSVLFKTDITRIQQIIINLVTNAVKYATRPEINVNVLIVNKEIVIDVSNHGDIDSHCITKLFDRFYRVDMESNDGSGLGLYIIKNIISKMGGVIQINSESSYITVRCIIPVDVLKSDNRLNSISILIVDDFIGVVNTKKLLLAKGIRCVDIVHSGQVAIEKKNINDYDVILMDKNMNKLSGPKTIKILRENGNTSIIYGFTGDCYNMSSLSKDFNMGPDGVRDILYKPLDCDILFEYIKRDLNMK